MPHPLITLFIKKVPPHIYERGVSYYLDNRVKEVHEYDRNYVQAIVQGSRPEPYKVILNWTPSSVRAICSCPYVFDCKHAVAVAIALTDREDSLRREDDREEPLEELEDNYQDIPDGLPDPPPDDSPALPLTWEDRIRAALHLETFSPAYGSTVMVTRVGIDKRLGLVLNVSRARWGKRGLGTETPVAYERLADSAGRYGNHDHLLLAGMIAPVSYDHRYLLCPRTGTVDAVLQVLFRLPLVLWSDTDTPLQLSPERLRAETSIQKYDQGWVITGRLLDTDGNSWAYPEGSKILHTHTRVWIHNGATFHVVETPDPPFLVFEALTRGIEIPDSELERFVTAYLPHIQQRSRTVMAPGLSGQVIVLPPRPILSLRDEGRRLGVELSFTYGDGPAAVSVSGEDPVVTRVVQGENVRWIRRDPDAENAFHQRLTSLGLTRDKDGIYRLTGDEALDFIAVHLPTLSGEMDVYGVEHLRRHRVRNTTIRPVVNLSSAGEWFELDIALEYGEGRVETDTLLPALQSGVRYVRLKDRRFLPMPEEWAAAARELLAETENVQIKKKRLRLPRFDVSLANGWLERAGQSTADDSWKEFIHQLESFQSIGDTPVPPGVRAMLRPYQKQGYNWLSFLAQYRLNGILADDMGLGKTLQALVLLLSAKNSDHPSPSLVVVPTSLVFNWCDEAARFTPALRVLPLVGTQRKKLFPAIKQHDVVLTTYALLARDGEELSGHDFNYLILDEAQRIKNPDAKTTRAAKALRARHRLAMTGTPLENNLLELWSIFDFLMPGFLGNRERFMKRYARPIQQDQDGSALEKLQRRLHPFVLRRLKEQVATELPPKTEMVLTTDLNAGQRRLYEQVLSSYRARVFTVVEEKGIAASTITILDALLKLRQICCHPQLLKLPGNRVQSSAKVDMFNELIADIVGQGHRVLVFSQFVEMLGILRGELKRMNIAYEYLDGATRNRAERVKSYTERDDIPVFLMSLKAGGVGLNLTAASYVIHFDPWWNPAVEAQATDRTYRIGQDKPVFSYSLITRGTVEEKIVKLQARKRALAEGLLSAEASIGKQLTRQDLEMLFRLDG